MGESRGNSSVPERREGAVFNMAFATLEKIHNLSVNYTKVSLSFAKNEQELINQQILKYHVAQQFLLQALPLIEEEVRKEIRTKFDAITFKWSGKSIVYSPETDKALNEFMIWTQCKLQDEENLFMPKREDPRYGWKQ